MNVKEKGNFIHRGRTTKFFENVVVEFKNPW